MNDPYFDAHFFKWMYVFFLRLPLLVTGTYEQLYSDEIQLFVMGSFAISAGFLGVFLVLKRLTMMANALSHTMLLGIVLACIYSFSFYGTFPSEWVMVFFTVATAICTSICIQELSRIWHLQEDVSNGVVFSSFFALGVTVLSLWSRNAHSGTELLMGNPDALQEGDIPLVVYSMCCALLIGWILLRAFKVSIFDSTFAGLMGWNSPLFVHILLILVALTTVSAFRSIGFIMTLTFFVVPPLLARLFVHTLKKLIFLASVIGVTSVIFSVAVARHLFRYYYLSVSTGALAAVLLGVAYLCVIVVKTKGRCMKSARLS